MQERVGIGGRVQDRLPASAAQITVVQSDELATAQSALTIAKALPIVLVALSLLLFAGALAVAPGWRRETLRTFGIGLVLAGAAALIVQVQAGTALVEALADTAAVEPAIAAAWTISTTLLVEAAWAIVLYGVFLFLAAWLAGPSRPAVAVRTALAPYVRRPVIAYSGFAVLIALLLWWAPTPATRDPVLALLLVALLALGAEALRRQIAREHPDADLDESLGRARDRVRRGTAWARQARLPGRVSVAGTAAPATGEARNGASVGSVEDERLERLERLGRLKESGVVDDHEFAAQKRLILEEDAAARERRGRRGASQHRRARRLTGRATDRPRRLRSRRRPGGDRQRLSSRRRSSRAGGRARAARPSCRASRRRRRCRRPGSRPARARASA